MAKLFSFLKNCEKSLAFLFVLCYTSIIANEFSFVKRKEKYFAKEVKKMSKIHNLEALSHEERLIVEARRAYQKKWRSENRDKVKAANNRYWLKKAAELPKEN